MYGECIYKIYDSLYQYAVALVEAAKRMLELYRPEKIWWHKYNNLWNDETKEKDKEKYNSVLRECAALCEIYDGESVAKIFTNKIVSSC